MKYYHNFLHTKENRSLQSAQKGLSKLLENGTKKQKNLIPFDIGTPPHNQVANQMHNVCSKARFMRVICARNSRRVCNYNLKDRTDATLSLVAMNILNSAFITISWDLLDTFLSFCRPQLSLCFTVTNWRIFPTPTERNEQRQRRLINTLIARFMRPT